MAAKNPVKAKINIRMVAEHVQLSPATVSLALRGSESISAETRARVVAAARELNYIPAPRSERAPSPANRHLVFVTRDFGDRPVNANPFYGEILSAAEQECSARGARLSFTLVPDTLDQTDAPLVATLGGARPDGILLAGIYLPAVVEQIVSRTPGPVVLVDNMVPGLACDSVMADDFGGAQLATNHLIELGHRHIAAIIGDLRMTSFAARYRGYWSACTIAGINALLPAETTWERASLRSALIDILNRNPRPTAIFCATDAFAVFVLELLREFGLRAPEDISVVGFDDLPIARMAHPALTTVHNDPRALGRLAVRRLMARIDGEDEPNMNITVATRLILRESTRPPTPDAV